MIDNTMMKYEVVCTPSYFDVGLLIETNNKRKPKRVLARASFYGSETEYGGVEVQTWVNTGVFLTKEEWKKITYEKGTNQILNELGIEKKIKKEESEDVTTDRQIVDDRAFEKNYNIEWYLGNGKIQTTSAVMTAIKNGYIYFRYPSGGIFVVKDDAVRSLQCLE